MKIPQAACKIQTAQCQVREDHHRTVRFNFMTYVCPSLKMNKKSVLTGCRCSGYVGNKDGTAFLNKIGRPLTPAGR